MERIPEGPSLFVANHSGGIWTPDSYMLGWAIYKTLGLDRMPYGLAHEVILSQPPVNQILCPLGVVRASHDNALRIFAAGRSALVYPGATTTRCGPTAARTRWSSAIGAATSAWR
ncbi:MAG: 1-acyl-sn-glycerol-3-phosphate acyltransferase [bacterium]